MTKPGWCGATGITDPGDPPEAVPVGGRYEAVITASACSKCGEGETWSVKGPDDIFIGQDWIGDAAECDANECATMLNAAYELGLAHSASPKQE